MELSELEHLVRTRRTVRHFLGRGLPEGVLMQLMEMVRWAPSGYNLQPTHLVVVVEAGLKKRLRKACMDQAQVEEAPAVVVFCGDRRVLSSTFHKTLEHPEVVDPANAKYREKLEKFVPLAFGTGPAGLGWMWKAGLLPMLRVGMAVPEVPAVYRRYWLAKQVMLGAMVFMLGAHAAGLGTCPMEGFDEGRVKKVLGLPRHVHVVLVVAVGFAKGGRNEKSRLPLERMVHWGGW